MLAVAAIIIDKPSAFQLPDSSIISFLLAAVSTTAMLAASGQGTFPPAPPPRHLPQTISLSSHLTISTPHHLPFSPLQHFTIVPHHLLNTSPSHHLTTSPPSLLTDSIPHHLTTPARSCPPRFLRVRVRQGEDVFKDRKLSCSALSLTLISDLQPTANALTAA